MYLVVMACLQNVVLIVALMLHSPVFGPSVATGPVLIDASCIILAYLVKPLFMHDALFFWI
jgi:hypothetical protein